MQNDDRLSKGDRLYRLSQFAKAEILYQEICNESNMEGCRKLSHIKCIKNKKPEAISLLQFACKNGDDISCDHIEQYAEDVCMFIPPYNKKPTFIKVR